MPALVLLKDLGTHFVERRWIVRRWNRAQRKAGQGKPWRFHTRREAEEWVLLKYPGLNRAAGTIDDPPEVEALYL